MTEDNSNWMTTGVAVALGVVTVVTVLVCLPLIIILSAIFVAIGKS